MAVPKELRQTSEEVEGIVADYHCEKENRICMWCRDYVFEQGSEQLRVVESEVEEEIQLNRQWVVQQMPTLDQLKRMYGLSYKQKFFIAGLKEVVGPGNDSLFKACPVQVFSVIFHMYISLGNTPGEGNKSLEGTFKEIERITKKFRYNVREQGWSEQHILLCIRHYNFKERGFKYITKQGTVVWQDIAENWGNQMRSWDLRFGSRRIYQ